MAALAVLPLTAATLTWRRVRWAPIASLLAVVTVIATRMVGLSFDLTRPGDVLYFAAALLELAAAGAVTGPIAVTLLKRHTPAITGGLGLTAALALGAGVVLSSPQSDDTRSLNAEQIATLPTVDMVNYRFEPSIPRAAPGQPVAFTFTNDTDDVHAFAVDKLGIDIEVPSGRTRTIVVQAAPGRYAMHCSIGSHQADGMKGQLVITGQDTMTPPRACLQRVISTSGVTRW
ncbi:cupredoxin domain-containing protein [Streptomyces sp. WI03-5b]|uniref:cupredoxin domain-containing protein n=1 Tax=Streptomyces sp. WI03-5b TaxID=462946 RepID=UPI0029A82388|nr:cupredoxin domain-containing protein [Streptomyces sp. WI03-5b]MDX2624931.1 cupredoxin domain-containing protein [Streptomyces sp. WI03-5b]